MQEHEKTFAQLLILGAAIGVGQLLASRERLTWRIVVGRAICSAGVAASAAALGLIFPSVGPVVQFGVAAAMASLGTSALEKLLQRVLR